ncbi:MAG TPA: hypothetical protein VMT18_03980 [Planctomycetota bacterium]|nr:hypothetical protein [Planctomycetota bacterium]
MRPLPATLAVLLLVGGATAWVRSRPAAPPAEPAPAAAGAVRGLLYAEHFRLGQAYAHTWRVEQPQVREGWLLVLEVERDVVARRQIAEPVLYVGSQTAERINDGDVAGRLVVIVPGAVDPTVDPAWFGAPALPEQVDAAALARERAIARAAGVPPLAAAPATRGDALGRPSVELADRTALERYAAELVLVWAPEERERAEGLLAPLVE